MEGEVRKPDIWVGTSLGVIKGVSLSSPGMTNYHKSMEDADRTQEVCAMCWEHDAQGDMLYCGLKNGVVQRFDCQERMFQAECDCTGGKGTFVGLGKHEEVMITCTDVGDLCYWPPDNEKIYSYVGKDVSCMCPSPDTMLQVATGGKENDLKIWDGNRPGTPVFQAKNVKNDKLDLRVPVWVSALGYVTGSGPQPTIAVATRYRQVRLYDTRVQKRPVYSQECGEHPFTSLCTTEDGRYMVVGNGVGDIIRCDLRTGRVLSHYKGCVGGIKYLQCYSDGSKNVLASCSLDRYLRVYTLEPPKLLHKVYLKLLPSCLLFSGSKEPIVLDEVGNAEDVRCNNANESSSEEEEEEEEEDELWETMKTVGHKKSLKSKTQRTQKKRKQYNPTATQS